MNKLKLDRFVLCLLCMLLCSCSPNIEQQQALAKEVSTQLAMNLKKELLNAMQSGGPEAAISVCNVKAQAISVDLSNRHNLEVGRTSLRLRNPKNQPDDWETQQLHRFEEQKSSVSDIQALEVSQVVKQNGQSLFRYMKVIPMQQPCTICHGTNIAPDIQTKINQLYPNDKATNFNVGDIRGAFSVEIFL